jgi:GntR family transcriptional regulator
MRWTVAWAIAATSAEISPAAAARRKMLAASTGIRCGALSGSPASRDSAKEGYDDNVSSTRSIMPIDPHSPVPLHEQVAAALRRAIADGEAGPGERLPPARDLAAVLGVNSNTVFRALRALRDEGLVEFRRGRGVTVTGEGPQRSVIVARARELVLLARRCGYRPEELVEIIEQVC